MTLSVWAVMGCGMNQNTLLVGHVLGGIRPVRLSYFTGVEESSDAIHQGVMYSLYNHVLFGIVGNCCTELGDGILHDGRNRRALIIFGIVLVDQARRHTYGILYEL